MLQQFLFQKAELCILCKGACPQEHNDVIFVLSLPVLCLFLSWVKHTICMSRTWPAACVVHTQWGASAAGWLGQRQGWIWGHLGVCQH